MHGCHMLCHMLLGAPNAWPTSFSLAASSDSTSGSDDEEARSPSSLGNMASRLMTQARQFTSQSGGGSPDGLTLGEQGKKHTASPGTQFASMILDKAQQLTGQAFGVSNFTSVDSPDHDMPELSSRGSSGGTSTLSGLCQNRVHNIGTTGLSYTSLCVRQFIALCMFVV